MVVRGTVRVSPEVVETAWDELCEDRLFEVAEAMDYRLRTVDVPGVARPVNLFEVGDPTDVDGCDADSERSLLCGGVLWPGARTAAQALAAHPSLAGKRVMEVGAGTGLVSLAASMLGAADVLATDHSPETLALINAAAEAQGLKQLRTGALDLLDDAAPLPEEHVDVAVAADLLYSEELARAVARTCARLARRGAALIVTDSQYRWSGAFTEELAHCLGLDEAPEFERRSLGAVTGWSYNDGKDATYEVSVNVLQLGAK